MPKTLSAPASSPAQARPAVFPAGEAGSAPDAQRLQAQLAGLVEKEGAAGELRPLLEFFRALLNARAVALLPADGTPAEPGCVVVTRGVTAGSVAQLVPTLAGQRAVALPAPALGADGYTLAVPVVRETRPFFWLVAQLTVASPRDLQAFLVLLQALAGSVLYREQRRATQEAHWALERTSGILEILRRAGSELDFAKACRIAVDDLRDYLGCSRVFLATRHRFGLQMRAVSGMARIDGKSTSHAPFEAAMREAVQAGTRLDFRPDSARAADTAAHEML